MNRGAFRIVGLGFAVLVASAAGCSEETDDGTGGGATTQTGTGGGTTQTGTGGGTTQTGTGGGTTQTGTGGGTTQTGTGMGGGGGGGGGATGGGGTGGTGGTGGMGPGVCGDNNLNPGELCDGSDLDGNDCTTLGAQFVSGTLACNANCGFWDVSACVVGAPVCGNDVAEFYEQCDGTDLGGATGLDCTDIGYTGGSITCTSCQYDMSTCTGGAAGWVCEMTYYGAADGCDCGCGAVDPDCADATAGSCEYCNDPGSCNGAAACADAGSLINATDNATCDAASCGNDIAQGTEICDGSDLRGMACEDVGQGFTGGTLACNACAHDTSGCTSATCGDDTAEGFEWCDGTDLGGADCEDLGLGFGGGTLACDGTCNFDTSGCTMPVCGDDTAGGDEYCDGTDLGGADCTDYGYTAGTVTCRADCGNIDLSACTDSPAAGWSCHAGYYDAADGCDCGCGVVDPDCADALVGTCDYCSLAGSCVPVGTGCPGTIDPVDNSQCN